MGPDPRRSLQVLNEEWSTCTQCELGERRNIVGGNFVAGEGLPRGVMFIGEGPGKNEEKKGRPFVGKSGWVLREIIARLGLTDAYITNIVTCRSCLPLKDKDEQLVLRTPWGGGPAQPVYKDQTPLKQHIDACLPRLYEEIYLVDPVIIVALGATAVSTLRKGSVSLIKERGTPEEITIPGKGVRPVLTEKKGVWARKVKGEIVTPVEQNEVRYLMLPTLHPAYVIRKVTDEQFGNPFQLLVEDLRHAVRVYNRYMLETTGTLPGEMEDSIPYDILDQMAEQEEQGAFD